MLCMDEDSTTFFSNNFYSSNFSLFFIFWIFRVSFWGECWYKFTIKCVLLLLLSASTSYTKYPLRYSCSREVILEKGLNIYSKFFFYFRPFRIHFLCIHKALSLGIHKRYREREWMKKTRRDEIYIVFGIIKKNECWQIYKFSLYGTSFIVEK